MSEDISHIQKWRIDELAEVVDKFEDVLAQETNRRSLNEKDFIYILVFLSGKSISTLKEVVCLCANGFPNGALSLARNLYEQLIIVAFFAGKKNSIDFSEYVSDFFDDYEIQRIKSLVFIEKHINQDKVAETALENKRKDIRSRTFSKEKGRYWWARESTFRKLEENVWEKQPDETFRIFLYELHVLYERACLAIHASCMGNEVDLGVSPVFSGVDTSPKKQGHETPLYFATSCLIGITGYVCNEFGIQFEPFKTELNNLANFYLLIINTNNMKCIEGIKE